MTKEEILENNQMYTEAIAEINKVIEENEKRRDGFTAKLIAPCNYCKFDGVYRCEACEEANYAGFNVEKFLTL